MHNVIEACKFLAEEWINYKNDPATSFTRISLTHLCEYFSYFQNLQVPVKYIDILISMIV